MKKFIVLVSMIFVAPLGMVFADTEKDVPTPTENNSTLLGDLIEKIKFKEESFGAKIQISVVTNIESLEGWRNTTTSSLEEPIKKVQDSREKEENLKPEVKAMSFLHLWGLKVLKFILNTGLIFYGLVVVLGAFVLKKIFQFIGWIFRKRAD